MTTFKLNYTGSEINEAIGKAQTSIQDTDIATSETAGLVKPDGTSITVTEDGTLTANSSAVIDDTAASTETTYSSTKIEKITGDMKVIIDKIQEISDRLLLLEE